MMSDDGARAPIATSVVLVMPLALALHLAAFESTNSSIDSRATHKTPNPYSDTFGYSRAVRRGPFIYVSGTTSLQTDPQPEDQGAVRLLHPGDAYEQTKTAIGDALRAVAVLSTSVPTSGGSSSDARREVTRIRMFVRRMEDTELVGRAVKEVMLPEGADNRDVNWAATMIVGVEFVMEEMLVEVEVDAVTGY